MVTPELEPVIEEIGRITMQLKAIGITPEIYVKGDAPLFSVLLIYTHAFLRKQYQIMRDGNTPEQAYLNALRDMQAQLLTDLSKRGCNA